MTPLHKVPQNFQQYFENSMQPVGYAGNRLLTRLEEMEHGDLGYTTGIASLDEYCRLYPTEMTTIAARSATGKTALGMQIVGSVIQQMRNRQQPGRVCVFYAEMDTETLLLRDACAIEGVSLWSLQTGAASETTFHRVRDRVVSLKANEILMVDDTSAPTLEHMAQQLDIIQEEVAPIRMVLFDYAELAGEWDKGESLRIAKISRGLKALAKRFKVPVVVLSQLNRDIEGRENKRPTMRDLMYGGEREPDRIIVMVRPWLYDDTEQKDRVDVTIVKNRNGPIGTCCMLFEGETMTFKSADKERFDLNGNTDS